MRPEDEIADMQRALDELSRSIIALSKVHREISAGLAAERRRLANVRRKEIRPEPPARPKKQKTKNPVRAHHDAMRPSFKTPSKPLFDFSGENIDLPGGRDLS